MTLVLVAVGSTLMYASPLMYAALGGVISERSGVINIGLEGMMTIGACVAVIFGYYTGNPMLGFFMGGVAGASLALLHAAASVSLRANQVVSGIALNFLGTGFALFLARLYFAGATQTPPVPNKMPKVLSGLFVNASDNVTLAFNQDAAVLMAFATVAIMFVVLYRTKWGLRIRAVGEHPAAAETSGINVYRIRYICVILSGFLAGLGGATMTLSVVSNFSHMIISGHGFIALAAVIFGRWTPHGAMGACLLFGFAQVMVVILGGGVLTMIDSKILAMIPYILTLVVLIVMREKSIAPKADGIPYERGSTV